MNYGVILASGKGSRVKSLTIPKQFYEINGIPIIIYTLRKILETNLFCKIYIAISKEYKTYTEELLKKYIDNNNLKKIKLVIGGKERIYTIQNVAKELENNNITENDIVLLHDAVRPFVTTKMLFDSVEGAKQYGATVAGVKISDSVISSISGENVDDILDRNIIYKAQSPDSFNLKQFIKCINNLTEEQKDNLVGTSQIFTFNNLPVKMIEGNNMNFKITTNSDLELAKCILK